jgi:two-component system invasion response regulator UvrY
MYNILIIENHEITRYGTRLILTEILGKTEISEATTIEESLIILGEKNFDLILFEIDLPGGNTNNIISQIRNKQKNVKILIFTSRSEDMYALNYLQAGADGFLSKSVSKNEFRKAITTLITTGRYISDNLRDKFINEHLLPGMRRDKTIKLSRRETEIMHLLSLGKSTSQIAKELHLRNSTVSTFKSRIFEKMQVDNLIDMIKKAATQQL